MKKLLSMILAVSLVLFSFAAFAETESVVEPLGGVIVEIGEEGLLLDQGDGNYVVVHMEESTPITGVEELEVGMYVFVRYNGVMSRSLPPQVTGGGNPGEPPFRPCGGTV